MMTTERIRQFDRAIQETTESILTMETNYRRAVALHRHNPVYSALLTRYGHEIRAAECYRNSLRWQRDRVLARGGVS